MARKGGSDIAQWAIQEGRTVLVWSARLRDAEQSGEEIEAIEELGWKLEHMAAYFNESMPSHAEVVFLFRRAR